MTTQPVEANVVLTADNSGYDQSMQASSTATDNLGKSVDSLGQKISKLTKAAGKGLIGIAATDVAMITGATAAWSSYEKQVSRLQAQATILTRTNTAQTKVMKDYTAAVKDMRTEFGTSTAEAAKLVEILSKVTAVRSSRDIGDLSKVFVEMGHATGESAEGLASSVTNLQKVMGTPINSRVTEDYADMFTNLSASTQGSAQSLIDFTAQLAPTAEAMGMNTKEIAGFAAAFQRSGQDGFAAANVFTKITNDITTAVATGSPELAQYANAVGLTTEAYKDLEPAEQVLRFFEALQKQGTGATAMMARFGLEGPRNIKAIQAVLAEAGGPRAAIAQAESGYGSGDSADAAKNSMRGMSDELAILKENIMATAEAMGQWVGPMLEKFVMVIGKASAFVRELAEGPMGKFLQVIMAIVAPLAGGAGALLLFAGALLKVAAAFMVFRNSMASGLREGARGGAAIMRDPVTGQYMARGEGALGRTGARLAEGPSTWMQRGMYNVGQAGGAALGGGFSGVRSGYQMMRHAWDPNWQPGPPRSMASYLAGGVGRGMQQFVTPQFDQMRHEDITKRTRWLGSVSPLTAFADRSQLSRQMGAVGTETSKLAAARAETARIHADPLLTNEERQARLDNVRQVRAETRERLGNAAAGERMTRETIARTEAERQAQKETRSTSVGLRRFGEGLRGATAGAVGGMYGAGRAGAGMLAGSPMKWPIGGMVGMAGMSGLGVQSNTMMLGAMGAMMGPWGALAGAGVGAGLDIVGGNDAVMDGMKSLKEGIEDGGTAFTQMSEDIEEKDEEMKDWFGSMGIGEEAPGYDNPLAKGDFLDLAETKNAIEGVFGSSDVEEAQREHTEAVHEYQNKIDTAKDIAEDYGLILEGTEKQQLKQLEAFMNDKGAGMLAEAGVDFEAMAALRGGGFLGQPMYEAFRAQVADPGEASGLNRRLRSAGGTGQYMMESDIARQSLKHEGNVALFYAAVDDITKLAVANGEDYAQIMKGAAEAQDQIGVENTREFEVQQAIWAQAKESMGFQMAMAPRSERAAMQLGETTDLYSLSRINETETAATRRLQSKRDLATQMVDEHAYYSQLLLAQDQFDLQKERAQEDFHQQRMWQEDAYLLQRERAEESFNRSRARSIADFHRSQRRAQYDFNLSRSRAEEDFRHQQMLSAEQASVSMYNVWERSQVQRTSSAEYMLSNAAEQIQQLQDQRQNLDELRGMGLSNQAIRVMGLNDPANAQQLARFLTEATPEMIKQANKLLGEGRTKAAKELYTDPSNREWTEIRRSFRRQWNHATTDFERSLALGTKDFKRGLRQQREDFDIVMDQQAEDYQTMMKHQRIQYRTQMDRAAEDLANMANEVDLTYEEVLRKSVNRLSGHAQEQAQAALDAFTGLKESTEPEAIALMQDLALIFGFKYKAPSGIDTTPSPPTPEERFGLGHAQGGVLPGWSPGRDDRMVPLSGGEAIMRPEWARAVGRETIDQMNHQARYGGFFLGGTMPLFGGNDVSQHPPGYEGTTWAGDINGPYDLSNPPARIRAWKSGTVADVTHMNTSYGNHVEINHPGNQNTLYAHMSSILVSIGDAVREGQMLGRVGDVGNANGVHLHFEIDGGQVDLGDGGGGGGGGAPSRGRSVRAIIADVLKRRYPKAEEAAHEMQGVHPLNKGDISTIINRGAARAIHGLAKEYGVPSGRRGYDTPGLPPGNYGSSAKGVWNALLAAGFSKIHAAGIMGNMQSESSFNPFIVQGDGNSLNPAASGSLGYGLVQWTPGSKLIPYLHGQAPSVSSEINALSEQLAGVGTSPEGAAGAALRAANTIREATLAFETQYERHAGGPQPIRIAQAKAIYDRFAAKGAIVNGAQRLIVGESGPEAVIPLDARGGEFMADVLSHAMGGRNTAPVRGGGTHIYARVDHSTNFTGPITVQANNPEELLHKLRARQRVMALSRPALTGSAA